MRYEVFKLQYKGKSIITFLFETREELVNHFDRLADGALSHSGENLEGVCVSKWDYYKFFKRNKIEKTKVEKQVYESVKPYMDKSFSTILLVKGFEEKYLIHEQTHALYELDRDFRKFVKNYVDSRFFLKSRLVKNIKEYYNTEKINDSQLYSEYAATLVEKEYYNTDETGICDWYERFVKTLIKG